MKREPPDPTLWQWTNDQPDTMKWVERFPHLEGEFGRLRGLVVLEELGASARILITGIVVVWLWHVAVGMAHLPVFGLAILVFAVLFAIRMFSVWRRLGLRYAVRDGTLKAIDTFGRVIWTERLLGLQEIRYARYRGAVWMTLIWPDRQREMRGIPSLLHALDD